MTTYDYIGGFKMRITVTVKGELEEYIKNDVLKNGISAGQSCLNLAIAGKEYKESLKSFSMLARALQTPIASNELEEEQNVKNL